MPNGMLFVSTDDDTHDRAKECRIWRSSDGGVTFVQVKTIVEGCALNWSFASDRENTLYMGEYGPKMPDCSKTVWRTRDYGDTWEVSLRLPNVEGIHVHVVAVDPYTELCLGGERRHRLQRHMGVRGSRDHLEQGP